MNFYKRRSNLKLPINKPIEYISPSTFMIWRKCQMKVYLTRLAGYKFLPRRFSPAAATGIYFDWLCKCEIARIKSLPIGRQSGHFLDNIDYSLPVNEIIEKACKAFEFYKNSELFLRILESISQLEKEISKVYQGIPILGIPDAIIDSVFSSSGPYILTPFDWKLRGFFSKHQSSLTQGYSRRYPLDFAHNNPISLEHVQEEWAIQLLFYNWLLGNMSN